MRIMINEFKYMKKNDFRVPSKSHLCLGKLQLQFIGHMKQSMN